MAADAISREIAGQLARRRRELGLSLSQVAQRCHVTLQQVQRYETAANVISAPMLWKLSRCLDVPIGYFFETVGDQAAPGRP